MTIKEIAQICQVSRGTVDRVLNGRGRVNPKTEALILRVMEREGYQKNKVGRALTVKKSAPRIGVILCGEGNPFFAPLIEGLHKAGDDLRDYGVTLDIRMLRGHSAQKQAALIDEMAPALAALIIQPISDDAVEARLRALLARRVPVIAVNTDTKEDCRCAYVGSDYEAGGATAAGLMKLTTDGRAKIGVLTGVETLKGHALRLKGFEERLNAACPEAIIIARAPARDEPETAYQSALQMLQNHPEIDALFVVAACVSDVCRAALDFGRADVRVIAFDDVPDTREMMRRGIVRAVVCQQPFEQGERALLEAFNVILSGTLPENRRVITENQIKILENL